MDPNIPQPVQPPLQSNPLPEQPKKSFFSNKVILIILGAIFILSSVAYASYFVIGSKGIFKKACTQEAKICPDGSSVGRTGPNCSFAPCPKTSPTPAPTANWKTYTNEKYEFTLKFPREWDSFEVKENKGGKQIEFGNSKISGIPNELELLIQNENNDAFFRNGYLLNLETYITNKFQPTEVKKISINQLDIFEVHSKNACPTNNDCIDILFKKENNLFTFHPLIWNDRYKNLEIIVQILSTFKFTDQTPTPTCRPRPACLDATPRCLIPETSDMCPKSNP